MHMIDMSKYNYRTDLVLDTISGEYKDKIHQEENGISVDKIDITDKNKELFHKSVGKYITITFQDITDKNNFKNVENILTRELKNLLHEKGLQDKTILIVGLGNEKSTPDSLGPKTINHILVTRHLFMLGDVEEGYNNVSAFQPQVTGITGIETSQIIESLVKTISADVLIVIDALASASIERVNKTIQITDTGIHPGSGVGNNRKEISEKTLKIPVIAIGVPTIVDAATIVYDTLQCMFQQISYKIDNMNNSKLKLIMEKNQNYKEHKNNLTPEQKEDLLGIVGTLDDQSLKDLVYEVLSPIDYNLMVTPKEVDFMIEKLSLLLANSLNKSLHKKLNSTN